MLVVQPFTYDPPLFLQAYIIKVFCKDGSNYHIYRRYSQFDQMQTSLEKRFLIEAGAIKSSDRVLPNLPGEFNTCYSPLINPRLYLFNCEEHEQEAGLQDLDV